MKIIQILKLGILVMMVGGWFYHLPALPAQALEIIQRNQMNVDDSMPNQDDNYLQADSIVVAPIFIEGDDLISDYDWYRGIYYYQAIRLNQKDFLFHYLITKSGQIFEGAKKGEEFRMRSDDSSLHPIVIGYMASKNDVEFDQIARNNLSQLILQIANRNSITLDRVYAKEIEFVAKPNEVVYSRFNLLGGKWERSLREITNLVKDQYQPQIKNFALQLVKVELPVNAVNYGDNIVMNITLKNNSDFILLKGNAGEPIMTLAKGNSSKFFINSTWLSLSQTSVMSEASYLRAGESKTFQVRLNVPLYFGLQTERFYLTDTTGKKYENSEFDVTLNINHPNKKVVEITKTETGQLNVRSSPWTNASIINRVTVGQRFVVLEETNDGWLNLELPAGKTGWVFSKYTKVV